MSTSITLPQDTHAFLRRLAAARARRPDRPFCYRPIEGYAFAWILHPGFDDGTRMAGLLLLDELTQAGLLRFDDDGFPLRATTFVLTEMGIAHGGGSREEENDSRPIPHVMATNPDGHAGLGHVAQARNRASRCRG